MSRIDEMTGCRAPQGLAEQSYITFVWITLQIWQPEREMCSAHQAHNEMHQNGEICSDLYWIKL